MTGIIYVLTNEAMPGLVKIGYTQGELQKRMDNLYTTGVALPFFCHFAAKVKNAARLEKTLHSIFSTERVQSKREFFRIDPERAVMAIMIGEHTVIDPSGKTEISAEELAAADKAKERRPRIHLEKIGIHTGETLVFSRDESIHCHVLEGNKVAYENESLSLSAAAVRALMKLGYKEQSVSGSGYWIFEEETLDERRRRLEQEQIEATEDQL